MIAEHYSVIYRIYFVVRKDENEYYSDTLYRNTYEHARRKVDELVEKYGDELCSLSLETIERFV